MSEYPLTSTIVSGNSCYPSTVQQLINYVADYMSVEIDRYPLSYKVQSSAPTSTDNDKPWFQTESSGSGYGLPKAVRLYVNGQWKEFSSFSQGDIILIPASYSIQKPWGVPGQTYSFGDTGIPNYTVPSGLIPPSGYQYKVYVGYYS